MDFQEIIHLMIVGENATSAAYKEVMEQNEELQAHLKKTGKTWKDVSGGVVGGIEEIGASILKMTTLSAGVITWFAENTQAFRAHERTLKVAAQSFKNYGLSAEFTTEAMGKEAEKLSDTWGVSVDSVEKGMAVLATSGVHSGKQWEQATEIAVNMAETFGTTIPEAADRLAHGMRTAGGAVGLLEAANMHVTVRQREMLKGWEAGQHWGNIMNFVLGQMAKRTHDAASEAHKTAWGIDNLAGAWEAFSIELGRGLDPAWEIFLDKVAKRIKDITTVLTAYNNFTEGGGVLGELGKDLDLVAGKWGHMAGLMKTFTDNYNKETKAFDTGGLKEFGRVLYEEVVSPWEKGSVAMIKYDAQVAARASKAADAAMTQRLSAREAGGTDQERTLSKEHELEWLRIRQQRREQTRLIEMIPSMQSQSADQHLGSQEYLNKLEQQRQARTRQPGGPPTRAFPRELELQRLLEMAPIFQPPLGPNRSRSPAPIRPRRGQVGEADLPHDQFAGPGARVPAQVPYAHTPTGGPSNESREMLRAWRRGLLGSTDLSTPPDARATKQVLPEFTRRTEDASGSVSTLTKHIGELNELFQLMNLPELLKDGAFSGQGGGSGGSGGSGGYGGGGGGRSPAYEAPRLDGGPSGFRGPQSSWGKQQSDAARASRSRRGGPPESFTSNTPMSAGERNFLGLVLEYESRGRNVMNNEGRSRGVSPTQAKGQTAQGYYQMLNSNWAAIAPQLGIKAPNALAGTFEEQTKVALALLRKTGMGNWTKWNATLNRAVNRGESAGNWGIKVPNTVPSAPPPVADSTKEIGKDVAKQAAQIKEAANQVVQHQKMLVGVVQKDGSIMGEWRDQVTKPERSRSPAKDGEALPPEGRPRSPAKEANVPYFGQDQSPAEVAARASPAQTAALEAQQQQAAMGKGHVNVNLRMPKQLRADAPKVHQPSGFDVGVGVGYHAFDNTGTEYVARPGDPTFPGAR